MDDIERLIKEENVDIFSPSKNHFERFEKKLDDRKESKQIPNLIYWSAAVLLLFIGINADSFNNSSTSRLASVSKEMKETESYFVNAINREIETIKNSITPDQKHLMDDAMEQIKILETNYVDLENALEKDGYERKVITAMIQNYQKRMEILEILMIQIENIKNKDSKNEQIL